VTWLRGRSCPGISMEITARAGLDRYTVARRLPDLELDGLIEPYAMRECTVSSRLSITWRSA
jgi:hypothetical protein